MKAAWDRLLAGKPPQDPLYLTNRTWKRKLAIALPLIVPALVVGALLMVGTARREPDSDVPPPAGSPRVESPPEGARLLEPEDNPDLEIVDISVDRSGPQHMVTGRLRNKSNRGYDSVLISFDLASETGSLVGSTSATVDNVAAQSERAFSVPILQTNAAFVLVRQIQGRR